MVSRVDYCIVSDENSSIPPPAINTVPTCHAHVARETAFSVDAPSVIFGRGSIDEVGDHAQSLGCRRVALFTDRTLVKLPHVARAIASLRAASIDVTVYDEVHVEPTDASMLDAAKFASDGKFDGYVSVGGGSVMDTCKVALLLATYPDEFLAYVNQPIGEGRAIPGPLPPHIACPTTCGTGAECTGIAVFDLLALRAKTGIASRKLRPTLAIVDPECAATLPPMVVAASGFDVLSHALESYTARPYFAREKPARPTLRPMSQGNNPWSDLGSLEALRIGGQHLVRAVTDPSDTEARDRLTYAATLAGIAFGNAGVHLPHGMSYAVAGLVRDHRVEGYPQEEPMVPHGISVIVSAPAVFRFTASSSPQRHLEAAHALGADTRGAADADAGEVLSKRIQQLMQATRVPRDLSAIGYHEGDLHDLTAGAIVQTRLLSNAPRAVDREALSALFRDALVAS